MSTAPHTAPTSPIARRTGRGEKPEAGPARFIADPAGLGLAGFALSTMVLSFINSACCRRTRCRSATELAGVDMRLDNTVADVSLNRWMALTPPELVLRRDERSVVPG